jgi:predicted HD superfamily hydrolase involved in NAD metabolism
MPVARAACARLYLARLRETLPEKRLSHCIFTAEYLSSYAESIGVEHDEAVAAGLLHDLCRDMGKSDLLAAARALRVPVSDEALKKPVLLHGPVAAERCRSEFGISDAVYEAIYWHTTGRPGLGTLGQGLCLADFAEPMRKFPEAAEARDILRKSGFAAAILYVAEKEVEFSKKHEVADPNSMAFYLWLKRGQA